MLLMVSNRILELRQIFDVRLEKYVALASFTKLLKLKFDSYIK